MFIHDAEGCGRGGGEQCGNRIFQYLTTTTATPPYDDAIIVTTKRRRTSCDLAEADARHHHGAPCVHTEPLKQALSSNALQGLSTYTESWQPRHPSALTP